MGRMEKKRRQQSWSFVAMEEALVDWPRIAGFLLTGESRNYQATLSVID